MEKIIIPEGWEIDKEKTKGNEIILKEKTKVDFSLLGNGNICYVKIKEEKFLVNYSDLSNYKKEGEFAFNVSRELLYGTGTTLVSNLDRITEIRLATQEELDILYGHHPELYPQKKWEDFGELGDHYYFELKYTYGVIRAHSDNRVSFKSEKTARAFEALAQLILWRDKVNGDWNPNWEGGQGVKFCISYEKNKPVVNNFYIISKVLCFKSSRIAEQFLKEHRDLIETAKELL